VRRIFFFIAMSVFASTMGLGIIVPLIPIFAGDIGASAIWIGLIVGSYSISRAFIMPFVGRLSDRYGRKLFLSIGLFTAALVSLVYIWALTEDSIPLLTLSRVLHGITSAMIVPIARAWLGDIVPKGEEGRWFSYFNVAFTAGLGAGPLLGGFLAERFGSAAPFLALSGLHLAAFIAVALKARETVPRSTGEKKLPSFAELRHSRMLVGIFIFRFGYEFAMGSFMAFLPVLAGLHRGLSTLEVSILFTVNLAAVSILMLFAGRLADRFNRRLMITIGATVNFAGLALMPFMQTFWQFIILILLRALGSTLSLPAQSALVVIEGRKYGMGQTMALTALAMSAGLGFGPILSGATADLLGINSVFYLAPGIGLVTMIAFIILSGKKSS
jgi:DHA1 family multidrug resistance protein-like MFS transporter